MRGIHAALPRTEVIGLVIFSLIIMAFTVSGLLSWWKEQRRTKK